MKPTIAVVITTRNRPSDLKRALRSICSQTVPPDEIIVVDDGSDDVAEEKDVFLECIRGIPHMRCTILRNPTPKGANFSRNLGIEYAKSTYVSLLDDDDEFFPDKISKVKSVIAEANPDLITHRAIVSVNTIGVDYSIHPRITDFQGQLVSNAVGTTSMVTVKKGFFQSCGAFDEPLPARQDYEAWLRALKNDGQMACIDEYLCRINVKIKRLSISTSIKNNLKAMEIIDTRFKDDILILSAANKKKREVAKAHFMIHKFLLNADGAGAFKHGIKKALQLRDLKLFIVSALSLLGPRVIFRLHSLRGRIETGRKPA